MTAENKRCQTYPILLLIDFLFYKVCVLFLYSDVISTYFSASVRLVPLGLNICGEKHTGFHQFNKGIHSTDASRLAKYAISFLEISLLLVWNNAVRIMTGDMSIFSHFDLKVKSCKHRMCKGQLLYQFGLQPFTSQ